MYFELDISMCVLQCFVKVGRVTGEREHPTHKRVAIASFSGSFYIKCKHKIHCPWKVRFLLTSNDASHTHMTQTHHPSPRGSQQKPQVLESSCEKKQKAGLGLLNIFWLHCWSIIQEIYDCTWGRLSKFSLFYLGSFYTWSGEKVYMICLIHLVWLQYPSRAFSPSLQSTSFHYKSWLYSWASNVY